MPCSLDSHALHFDGLESRTAKIVGKIIFWQLANIREWKCIDATRSNFKCSALACACSEFHYANSDVFYIIPSFAGLFNFAPSIDSNGRRVFVCVSGDSQTHNRIIMCCLWSIFANDLKLEAVCRFYQSDFWCHFGIHRPNIVTNNRNCSLLGLPFRALWSMARDSGARRELCCEYRCTLNKSCVTPTNETKGRSEWHFDCFIANTDLLSET